ncbi:MAG: Uma2 family endonuclease, partial [Rudanella sp.]|nr:Uma2 family endonuclease [Rudanella sp.]
MTLVAEKLYSVEEYLEMEERSTEKSDYFDGEIIPMAGAKFVHNLIATNTTTALSIALEEKEQNFLVINSDTKIHIPRLRSFVYPDAVVVCEAPEFYEGREDIILNPLLVVEVLSPGTERYDRRSKFGHYKTLPSFQEYVLVDQHLPFVTASYKIAERTWQDTDAEGIEATIYLRSLDVTLSLKRLYKGIVFVR